MTTLLLMLPKFARKLRSRPARSLSVKTMVGDTVYLMLEGSAGIYRGESDPPRYLAVLQAPTVVGEMAVINQGHIRTANVKAMSNMRLLAIPIPLLDPLLRRFPRLGENLQNLVAERMVG